MQSDIIIVGGGIVGLTLALALAQQTSLSITLLEAKENTQYWSAEEYHHRVSAITLASQRIFQSLQVWDALAAKRVSSFKQIKVWDGATKSQLCFDSREIGKSLLGHIVENNLLTHLLREKINQYPQIKFVAPLLLKQFTQQDDEVLFATEDDRIFRAKLAVAADGANSWLRTQAHLAVEKFSYEQHALIATVQTEQSHEQTARQVFLADGPLAFLPLVDAQLSSIVWSVPNDKAKALQELTPAAFTEVLEESFPELGRLQLQSQVHAFPLYKQQVKNYVQPRLALVGDAAHTIHPLAGQGVNMGLLDAATLAEVIINAEKLQRNFASFSVLRAYERWRKADNLGLLMGVDVIKNLFAKEGAKLQSLGALSLKTTQQIHWLRNIFTRHAVGDRYGLPRLASSN